MYTASFSVLEKDDGRHYLSVRTTAAWPRTRRPVFSGRSFMNPVYQKLLDCVSCVRQKTDFVPKVALVLGSGLGGYAEQMDVACEIDYHDIDGLPVSTAPGHAGKFEFGYLGNVPVVLMNGRVHYYEGYPMQDVVLPVRLMHLLGADTLFLTNASGGINPSFQVGDLMMITGQISSFVPNPLVGENIPELGVRFPDMTHVYDERLQDIIRRAAKENGIPLQEGVYLQTSGPSYETPEEIRMFRTLGADAVGMSTVVEAIAANHMGMKICGISCISNKAAGMNEKPLTQEEVKIAGEQAAPRFTKLVTSSILAMAGQEDKEKE